MNLVRRLIEGMQEKRRRVVVVGDAMTDVWVRGTLGTCQDGCQKFTEELRCSVHGGAANASRSLENWPVDVNLFSADVWCRKTRYVDSRTGRIAFRADLDRVGHLPIRGNVGGILYSVECADVVVLSDYDKGLLTPRLIQSVADLCRKRGVPCVADCKREPSVYGGCILKVNSDYQQRNNVALAHHIEAGGRLVVTAGSLNPIVWSGERCEGLGYDLPAVECVNHVGAGDCFTAHLALALACEFSLKDAAAVAHSAGRVYVGHPHNRPPHPHEVEADLLTAK